MKKIIYALIPALGIMGSMAFVLRSMPDCPPYGNATDEKEKALNILKNRTVAPSPQQIEHTISIDGMYNSKDDATLFDTKNAATIEGRIFSVEQEKKGESSNCNATEVDKLDITIYLAKDDRGKRTADCIIAEVTPASRKLHPNWTLKYLKSLESKHVKITGWMLFDYPNVETSAATKPNSFKADRRTVWEVHPVTEIRVDE